MHIDSSISAVSQLFIHSFMDEFRSSNPAELHRTVSHEVAHGAFVLYHTFSEFPALQQATTDNLMDYTTGTRLCKYQWDLIHDPVWLIVGGGSEEEGAILIGFEDDTKAIARTIRFIRCARAKGKEKEEIFIKPTLDLIVNIYFCEYETTTNELLLELGYSTNTIEDKEIILQLRGPDNTDYCRDVYNVGNEIFEPNLKQVVLFGDKSNKILIKSKYPEDAEIVYNLLGELLDITKPVKFHTKPPNSMTIEELRYCSPCSYEQIKPDKRYELISEIADHVMYISDIEELIAIQLLAGARSYLKAEFISLCKEAVKNCTEPPDIISKLRTGCTDYKLIAYDGILDRHISVDPLSNDFFYWKEDKYDLTKLEGADMSEYYEEYWIQSPYLTRIFKEKVGDGTELEKVEQVLESIRQRVRNKETFSWEEINWLHSNDIELFTESYIAAPLVVMSAYIKPRTDQGDTKPIRIFGLNQTGEPVVIYEQNVDPPPIDKLAYARTMALKCWLEGGHDGTNVGTTDERDIKVGSAVITIILIAPFAAGEIAGGATFTEALSLSDVLSLINSIDDLGAAFNYNANSFIENIANKHNNETRKEIITGMKVLVSYFTSINGSYNGVKDVNKGINQTNKEVLEAISDELTTFLPGVVDAYNASSGTFNFFDDNDDNER